MTPVLSLLGAALLITGTLFCVLGVYGLVRLSDIYTRLHATGAVITVGAGSVFLSLLFIGPTSSGLKGLATTAFLLLTAPMVTHTVARAFYRMTETGAPESGANRT